MTRLTSLITASFSAFALLSMPLIALESFDSSAAPDLSGTWSDPPPRAEDSFCHIGCAIEAREYLTSLLDDPANIERSFAELKDQAMRFQITELMPSYMTAEALEKRANRKPPPPSAYCEPWGLVRIVLAPHAMRLTQYENHITLYYSEWTILRHVYLDGHEPASILGPAKYGYSVGHYEGNELVIETTGLMADNFGAGGFMHSDQAKVIERYRRTGESGDRLEVHVELDDPVTYKQTLHMARAWAWAPGEEIFPYESCVIPTD